MNPNNPHIQEEDAIDVMALFFAVLSHRWIIITSITIFSIRIKCNSNNREYCYGCNNNPSVR